MQPLHAKKTQKAPKYPPISSFASSRPPSEVLRLPPTDEAVPAIATIARIIDARGGKVYVDFGQNGPGQTIVAPLSLRPLPGAPVSTPLRWTEVTARLDPRRFTIRTVPARLDEAGDPMAPVLGEGIDVPAALGRLDRVR